MRPQQSACTHAHQHMHAYQHAHARPRTLRQERLTFRDVQIEKVAIECRLDAAGDNGDQIEESVGVVAEDPVGNVQGTIGAQSEQIVRCDGLCFTSLANHEQLRQDGHRLKVNTERPENLENSKTGISQTPTTIRMPSRTPANKTHQQQRECLLGYRHTKHRQQ